MAIAVVSGRIAGKTETLTLHVDEDYLRFNEVAAYTTSLVLALLHAVSLIALIAIPVRQGGRGCA